MYHISMLTTSLQDTAPWNTELRRVTVAEPQTDWVRFSVEACLAEPVRVAYETLQIILEPN